MAEFKTLVADIQAYLRGHVPPDEVHSGSATGRRIVALGKAVCNHTLDIVYNERKVKEKSAADTSIRMSEIGERCFRKLYYKWYKPEWGQPDFAEPDDPMLPIKFAYGDYVEELTMFLAEEAGHKVTERQREFTLRGTTHWYLVGHIDGKIDGVLVDVKSSADVSWKKYAREGLTGDNDSFGYRWQLDAYGISSLTDERAFLFVNKHDGHINVVNRTGEVWLPVITKMESVGMAMETALTKDKLPDRLPTETTKYGEKLCVNCSYCAFKHVCWDKGLHSFIASGRPHHYVTLNNEGEKFAKDKTKIETPKDALLLRVEGGGSAENEEPPF